MQNLKRGTYCRGGTTVTNFFKHFYGFVKDYMDNTQNPFRKSKV